MGRKFVCSTVIPFALAALTENLFGKRQGVMDDRESQARSGRPQLRNIFFLLRRMIYDLALQDFDQKEVEFGEICFRSQSQRFTYLTLRPLPRFLAEEYRFRL